MQKVKKSIENVLSAFVDDKKNLGLFDEIKIRALDRENNLRMKLFDLLIDKVESDVLVQRKPKHKVLISVDAFDKIKEAMIEQHI